MGEVGSGFAGSENVSWLLATALLPTVIGCASLPDPEQRLAAFEARAEMCAHWGGEYDYDAERAAQIRAALREGRCDSLDVTPAL